MKNIGLQIASVLATIVLFALALVLNEWIFGSLEFVRGVNWIYLPAGMRLLCTLLFAEAGALGLLLISLPVCYFYFFPTDLPRAVAGGIVAALAPYAVYRMARRCMGLRKSLANLTGPRLLLLAVLYALANAALHQVMALLIGRGLHLDRTLVMLLGDLCGTLIVLYVGKVLLMLLPMPRDIYDLKR